MNIAFLIETFPSYASKLLVEIINKLPSGNNYYVITTNYHPEGFNIPDNFSITPNDVMELESTSLNLMGLSLIFIHPKAISNLPKIFRRLDIDVIHNNSMFKQLGLCTSYYVGKKSILSKMVSTSHGIPFQVPNPFIKTFTPIIKYMTMNFVVKNSEYITCVSHSDEQYWLHQNVPKKKLCVIPNGVDTVRFNKKDDQRKCWRNKFNYDEDNVVFLFLAHLRFTKGVNIFLNAAKYVSHKDSATKFFICGRGPLSNYVNNFIQKHNLSDAVQFINEYIPENDLVNIYNLCDAYVLPSFNEGMPLSLLEAMSCGKPVIATNVGEVPYFINSGKNGLLIDPSVSSLVKAIERVSKDIDFRNNLGAMARKTALKFDWADISENYYYIFKSCARRVSLACT